MLYQVRANFLFDSQDEANDFYHDCEVALPKATFINPDTEALEYSEMDLIENRHDEHPPQPCTLIEHANNKPPEP